MNKKLAIIGHPLEGNKVIEILKMLGGREVGYNGLNSQYYYYIDEYGNIAGTTELPNNKILFVIYTLKEFLEKFPYKIGDKIIYQNKRREITKMVWEEQTNTVAYKLDDKLYCNAINELQPYKEETVDNVNKAVFDTNSQCFDTMNHLIKGKTMEEIKIDIDIPRGYEFTGVDDNNRKVVFTKIRPQYPKTYEECCEVLGIDTQFCMKYLSHGTLSYKDTLIYNLQALLICRDAYWKIAGEQMGLGKSWKPDFTDDDEERYSIYTLANKVERDFCGVGDVNTVLCFSTEEMRDAFYENFKDLIENCKELL